ncbi:MAG TPA: hypothetical protein VJK06_01440 [Methyloceanibacter sp.]|jgi:hypothetical protein|nr:hypothetical protein [Methyloceanibacter sp.]
MYRLAFLLSIFSAAAFGAFVTCASAAASLEGSWSGSGVITHGGGSDQVHCRVRYTKAGGSAYTYTSTCATDTGRYELLGRIKSSGGNRYTGTVSSPNYKGTGNVLLFQKGNHLSITVTSGKGSARMTLSRR